MYILSRPEMCTDSIHFSQNVIYSADRDPSEILI